MPDNILEYLILAWGVVIVAIIVYTEITVWDSLKRRQNRQWRKWKARRRREERAERKQRRDGVL